MRKTYREIKQSPSIKTPVIAWVFERPIVYIGVLFAFVFVISGYLLSAIDRVNAISNPVVETPWLEVTPEESTAIGWLKSISKEEPLVPWAYSGVESINPPGCTALSVQKAPETLLGAVKATSDNNSVVFQVYTAGQALPQWESYKTTLGSCFELSETRTDDFRVITWENGALLTSGDAIVGIQGSSYAELLAFYEVRVPETLTESGCSSLSVTSSDPTRSIFHNRDTYTGLLSSEVIESEVDISGLPTPTNSILFDIEWSGNMDEPEGPLPEGFPKLPEEVSRPSIPVFAPRAVESKTIGVLLADPIGPGCGWNWSGQVSPIFDETTLRREAASLRISTQNQVNDNAKAYLEEHASWVSQVMALFPEINSWNIYAKQVDSVKARWWKLITDREDFKPLWLNYIDEINYYNSFDRLQSEAKSSYEKEVEACKKAQEDLEKWEKEKAEFDEEANTSQPDPDTPETEAPSTTPPTTSPTPTLRPKPAGCPVAPVEPEILTQSKPSTPIAPTLPEGVTIPDSWPKAPTIQTSTQPNN